MKFVITEFVAGKIAQSGNPRVTLTIKTALMTQAQLEKLARGETSNYIDVTFEEKSPHPARSQSEIDDYNKKLAEEHGDA